MRFSRFRFILLVFFSLLSANSFAQKIFIANDFGNCGVGLRDSASNKWLVEPIYQKITEFGNGYYRILAGSKEGVVDSTGRTVISPIYDFVYSFHCNLDSSSINLFVIENGKNCGLVNEKNEIIIPVVCRSISVFNDGNIIASKKKNHYSFYNLKGEETVIPGKMPEAPYELGDHLYEVSRTSFGVHIERSYYHRRKRLGHWQYFHRRRKIVLNEKFGMMNDSMHLLIPKKFSSVAYHPGKYNLVNVTKRKKSGYYDVHGKMIWPVCFRESYPYKDSYYDPRYGSVSMINAAGYTIVRYKRKYGIIAENGDTLLPFTNSSIYSINARSYYYSSDNWIVGKDHRYGIYDATLKTWVVQPEYYSLSTIGSYSAASDTLSKPGEIASPKNRFDIFFSGNTVNLIVMVARKNGKFGVVTSAGQEILPFEYDNYEVEFETYFFKKGVEYTTLTFPEFSDTSTAAKNSGVQQNVVDVCPKTKLFEKIEKGNGSILFINKDLLNDSAHLRLYGLKNRNLMVNPETCDSLLHATAILINPLVPAREFPKIGPVYDFHNRNLNYGKSEEQITFCIDTTYYYRIKPIVKLDQDSFHTYYNFYERSGIFREDGVYVLRPYSYYFADKWGTENGLDNFIVDAGKNKTGIIDGNGKLLIDTVWGDLSGQSGNYIWAIKKQGRKYWKTYYNWNILDTTSHQLLLNKKQCSNAVGNFGKTTVVIERKEGQKLYNFRERKYILTGNVNTILPIDDGGNYFAVRTCFGNIGIIDGNGKWIADTCWTAMINATNNIDTSAELVYKDGIYQMHNSYNLCVLSNDTGWNIFNSYTGKKSHDSETARMLLYKSENSFRSDSIHGKMKFCSDCPSFVYSDEIKNHGSLLPWQENLLFDSLFSGERFMPDTLHAWFIFPCSDCRKRNSRQYFQYVWAKNYSQEVLNHTIEFVTDSCISVTRENIYYSFEQNDRLLYPKDYFFTVMLFNDGPHTMLLDSLFTGTEWKTMISKEITEYFSSHPEIEGNCHNPFMLPFVLKDRFVITREGIRLFPPDFKEDSHQLSVTISWEKLNPYLRKDVASKLMTNYR